MNSPTCRLCSCPPVVTMRPRDAHRPGGDRTYCYQCAVDLARHHSADLFDCTVLTGHSIGLLPHNVRVIGPTDRTGRPIPLSTCGQMGSADPRNRNDKTGRVI